jgi:hypothetical protein
MVLHCARKVVFGCEPVVSNESSGLCSGSDLPSEIAVSDCRAKDVRPAVQVKDRGTFDRIRRFAPPSRHSADRLCLVAHVLGRRRPCNDLVENGACFGSELQRRLKPKFGSHDLHGGLIRQRLFVVIRIHLVHPFACTSCRTPVNRRGAQ